MGKNSKSSGSGPTSTQMDGPTYLGCRQDNIEVDDCIKDSMDKWKPIFEWCTSGGNMSSQTSNAPANESQEAAGNSKPGFDRKEKETSYAKAMRGESKKCRRQRHPEWQPKIQKGR